MGEARRRADQGLSPRQFKTKKESSSNAMSWLRLPKADNPREQFYAITQRASWIGIGVLAVVWIVVRFVGPAAGWWTPADAR